MKIKQTAHNTVTVTRAYAAALGLHEGEEQRAGKWGFTIGNMWAPTRKQLHEMAWEMIKMGAAMENWQQILLESVDSRGLQNFTAIEEK